MGRIGAVLLAAGAATAATTQPGLWQPAWDYLVSNWIDIGSILVSIIAVIRECSVMTPRRRIVSLESAIRVAHMTVLFPLFILSLSFLHPIFPQALLQSNRLILTIAGITAISAIIDNSKAVADATKAQAAKDKAEADKAALAAGAGAVSDAP